MYHCAGTAGRLFASQVVGLCHKSFDLGTPTVTLIAPGLN
jgi:hypothetical protein